MKGSVFVLYDVSDDYYFLRTWIPQGTNLEDINKELKSTGCEEINPEGRTVWGWHHLRVPGFTAVFVPDDVLKNIGPKGLSASYKAAGKYRGVRIDVFIVS